MQLTLRYANTKEARPRWRFNAAYGLSDRLLLGLEYNPAVGEVNPTANWTLLPEKMDAWPPMISLGTSSDRIFSPPGTQSYFLTFAKSLPRLKLDPYVSLNYSEWERTFTVPFGISIALQPQWSLMIQNDGRNTHWLLNRTGKRNNVSLILINGRHFGISTGVKI
ncbi:MAG: hypothetical protein JNJ45_10450 [Chthonomonas sp.]|nr:hypothetical protein [Chthonomonas sp.]